MECPRCGSELDRYVFGDCEAVDCDSCGFVGVPVEHRGERLRLESWDEAIARYADSAVSGSVAVETVDGEPALELVLDADVGEDASPEPTVVRIDRPDPALAAAFEAADGSNDRFVCAICDSEFDTQSGLYGHLGVHSGEKDGRS